MAILHTEDLAGTWAKARARDKAWRFIVVGLAGAAVCVFLGGVIFTSVFVSKGIYAWLSLPGVQWRIEAGTGLLGVRSAHLGEPDDWHTTADLAEPRGDGAAFALRGRADRLVKIEEKRVSLTAMERLLAACDEVDEARVIMLRPAAGDADGAAAAVRLAVVAVPSAAGRALLREGKRRLNERLRGQLLQGVERVALPRRFRYVDALPVNAQGKVPEALLAALFKPSMPPVVWHEREATHASAELALSPDLRVFDGHFPEAAILPGVAQLDWAIRLGQSCFAVDGRFARVDHLKFLRPVRPGTVLRLALQWRAESGTLAFTCQSGEGLHASGKVVFVPRPGGEHG